MADGGACARLQPEFVLCTLAFAGWIAVSDGLIDRNGNRSGPTSPLSMPLQSALPLLHATSLAWLWHSDAAFELKAVALATGSLLATPYVLDVLDYDIVVLAVAIAFFARHGLQSGFADFEISVLAAAWIVPLLARGVAGATGVPLGLIVLLILYGFVLRRVVLDHAVANDTHRIAQA
jgi:alpha-1,2-mannosyltransferase